MVAPPAGSYLTRGGPGGHCRYPRTGVPSLAVSRQGLCNYPWLRPNSRTPVVRSPDSLDNGPGPVSRLGKIRERRVSRERRALSPNSRGSGPPVEPGPPRSPGPLMGSRTTCIVTGPLAKGRSRRPASGWSEADTCLQARTRIQGPLVSIQGPTHHCIHCGRWTSALM